ncbi:hypothetical protein ACOME3_009435 [Neoechinorhynchus agilis]
MHFIPLFTVLFIVFSSIKPRPEDVRRSQASMLTEDVYLSDSRKERISDPKAEYFDQSLHNLLLPNQLLLSDENAQVASNHALKTLLKKSADLNSAADVPGVQSVKRELATNQIRMSSETIVDDATLYDNRANVLPMATLSPLEKLKNHQAECVAVINEMETTQEEKDMLIQVQCNSIFQEIPKGPGPHFEKYLKTNGLNGSGKTIRNGRSNGEFPQKYIINDNGATDDQELSTGVTPCRLETKKFGRHAQNGATGLIHCD